jgi:hypothetical protein
MDDVNMGDVTMKMYEDAIKSTKEKINLALLNEIHELKEAGKTSDEILKSIEAELKK